MEFDVCTFVTGGTSDLGSVSAGLFTEKRENAGFFSSLSFFSF